MNTAFRYRCPLARFEPDRPDTHALKRDGWRDQRILVVNADDDRLDGFEREFVRQIGERLYGAQERSR